MSIKKVYFMLKTHWLRILHQVKLVTKKPRRNICEAKPIKNIDSMLKSPEGYSITPVAYCAACVSSKVSVKLIGTVYCTFTLRPF